MKTFFKKRKQKKQYKELLNAKHARNMREDIAKEEDLDDLEQAKAKFNYFFSKGHGRSSKENYIIRKSY